MDVYVSGSITHIPKQEWGIYEKMGEVIEDFGLSAYIPHIHTPQTINQHIDTIVNSTNDLDGFHKDVFSDNVSRVEASKLIIAEVSNPPTGSGIELGIALRTGKPIICLANKNAVVTPLVIGASQLGLMQIIRYESEKDALYQLKNILETKFVHLTEETIK